MKEQPNTIISQLIGGVSTFLIFRFDLYTSNCKYENFSQYLEFQVSVWVYVCELITDGVSHSLNEWVSNWVIDWSRKWVIK